MNILMALFIGLAVNLDNLLIGINLGIRRQRLTLWQNLVIGSTTGLCAFSSTCAARLISGNFLVYTNLVGAAIMIFFGIFCLYQGITKKEETPDLDAAPRFMDILILGFVLAVNCIPPAFSAGVMQISPWWVGFFSMLFSCLSIHISVLLGQRFLRCRFFSVLTPLSAVLLILIGALELIL